MRKRKQLDSRNLKRVAMGILLLTTLSASCSSVGAQSGTGVEWTGIAGDGKWETPQNWSTNRVPDASSAVLIRENCEITVSKPVEIYSLTMSAEYCCIRGTESSKSVTIRACENVSLASHNRIYGLESSAGKDGGNVEICSERGSILNHGDIYGGFGGENTNSGSVTIFATNGHIQNHGYIGGSVGGDNGSGGNVEITARGNLTNSSEISGGHGGTNGKGGEVRIAVGGNITNDGSVNGGYAGSGGNGGSVVVKAGGNITNKGRISGGNWEGNGLGGSVDIRANGNITNDAEISEGTVLAKSKGLLKEDSENNLKYGVFIRANGLVTIGRNGKISASRIVSISAGSSVSMKEHQGDAITTEKDVYISVSREGSIDLTEIRKNTKVIRAKESVFLSDTILKNTGVTLADIVEATDIVTGLSPYEPSKESIPEPEECMLCSDLVYCDPPIWGNFLAFPAVERSPDSNVKSSGKSGSIILCYKNLKTGQVSKTDLLVSDSFHSIDIYQTTIAFVNQDSGILYLDINTGNVEEIGVKGYHPSIYGNFIAFVSEGRIFCFDLTTRTLLDTQISGDRPSIWKEKIVFHTSPRPTIQIYDLSTRTVIDTSIAGLNANIYESKIVFETPESLVSECLNGDGDMDDVVIRSYDLETQKISNTGAAGIYPVVYGDTIAFTVREQDAGIDLNGDGQLLGNVIHCYSFETGSVINTQKLGTEPDIFDGTITYYVWEHWMGKDLNGDGDLDDSVLETFEIPVDGMAVQDQETAYFLAISLICVLVLMFRRKR
ncbi:MAG: S-layer family protein [Theionarchaea archaeon]|nr:S-layer family protein [Theionarchaea archaeon]MBU7038487.1 S-layer family protein [Theionarchaea archaeon]